MSNVVGSCVCVGGGDGPHGTPATAPGAHPQLGYELGAGG